MTIKITGRSIATGSVIARVLGQMADDVYTRCGPAPRNCRRLWTVVFDRRPASTGYKIELGAPNGSIGRLDVWPADSHGTGALVILSTNGVPVSTWTAPLVPFSRDVAKLWEHYQKYRGDRPPRWRGLI